MIFECNTGLTCGKKSGPGNSPFSPGVLTTKKLSSLPGEHVSTSLQVLINTVTIFVFPTWTSAVSFLFCPIHFGMLKKYHSIWITLLMLKVLCPELKHLEVLLKLYKF